MATHSSTLAWIIPWTEEPGGLQSMGSQRVRHDWATSLHLQWITFLLNHTFRQSHISPVFFQGTCNSPATPHLCCVSSPPTGRRCLPPTQTCSTIGPHSPLGMKHLLIPWYIFLFLPLPWKSAFLMLFTQVECIATCMCFGRLFSPPAKKFLHPASSRVHFHFPLLVLTLYIMSLNRNWKLRNVFCVLFFPHMIS